MSILLSVLLSAKPSLELTVTNLRSERGALRLALFSTSRGWPEDDAQALRRAAVRIVNGQAKLTFDDLPPGKYAAIAFHDEDADGRLAKGAFGIPKEGWGASNDARGVFGPSFAEASFVVRAESRLTFSVRY